jgi:O-antigen/teichoic acid export membrane protein
MLRRMGWCVADQIVSSATNFLLGIGVARSVGVEEFGAFSIAYATYTLTLGAARALILEPLVVRFSASSNDEWRHAVAAGGGTSVLFGVAVGAAMIVASSFSSQELGIALLLIGIALPGLLLQDAWRFAFFAQRRGDLAFWNDLIWAACLVPGAIVLVLLHSQSVAGLITVWALSGWAAAVAGFLQSRVRPRTREARGWLHRHGDLAYRFFGEFLISSGAGYLSVVLVGTLASLTDVGRLAAGQMIVLGPLNILFLGAGLMAVPETAKLLSTSLDRMTEGVRLISLLLALGAGMWVSTAWLLPPWVGFALLGENWSGGRSLLGPMAVAATAIALSYGAMTGLRTLAAARLSLRARILDAVVTLSLTAAGTVMAGATGACWGIAAGACLRIPNWWWHFGTAAAAARPTMAGRRPALQ